VIDVDDRLAIGVGETVAGLEPEALAALAGTPFYAYDFDVIERGLSALRDVLPASMGVAYATKANPSLAVVAHLARLGAAGDIASAGELELIQLAGMDPARVVFTGPGKTEAEHRAAIAAGIRAITVESPGELARLERVAAEMGARVPILLRRAVGDRARHESVRIIGDAGARQVRHGFLRSSGDRPDRRPVSASRPAGRPRLRRLQPPRRRCPRGARRRLRSPSPPT
jgi:diaminopimelate decarboxylase